MLFFCREQILLMVEENPVIVVKGEPGCGKSTQVPQYIMEHWEASRQGAHCNIIVTQPRRLSAISLAEWVAHERQERVSGKVTLGFELNELQFKGYRIVTRQVDLAMMLWILC
jgi:HrpA-like RNA helicase